MPAETNLDIANPANPANYEPHPMGYCCRDCNASARVGQATRHSSRCDIAPREYVLPSDQSEGGSSKRSTRRGTSANQMDKRADRTRPDIAAAAKGGFARLHYSDDDISLAVRSGEIGESDAMNQDL